VLGYDLRCFGCTPKAAVPDLPERERDSMGWVPTGNPFSQVINDYLLFRRQGGKGDKASFVDWLSTRAHTERPVSRATAQDYCFAFSMQEFDLFDRSLTSSSGLSQGARTACVPPWRARCWSLSSWAMNASACVW
jgi:hypothetical protein